MTLVLDVRRQIYRYAHELRQTDRRRARRTVNRNMSLLVRRRRMRKAVEGLRRIRRLRFSQDSMQIAEFLSEIHRIRPLPTRVAMLRNRLRARRYPMESGIRTTPLRDLNEFLRVKWLIT